MKTTTQRKTMKLAAVLAMAACDAFAEERQLPAHQAAIEKADRIVVSITDRKLLLLSGEQVLKVYPVAVGKPSTPSPQGTYEIINRVKNPAWYGPDGVVAPGRHNPLGTRWMGLSAKGYGIHGTNVPSSIGKAASHGCIRMAQADLEELFEMVTVGAMVELRGESPRILTEVFAANAAN